MYYKYLCCVAVQFAKIIKCLFHSFFRYVGTTSEFFNVFHIVLKEVLNKLMKILKKKSKSKDGICQFLQIYTETPNVQIGTVLERMTRDNRWPTTKKGLWLCKKFRHYKWLCNDPNGSNDCWYGNEQDIYGSILHNPTETSTLRPIWKCILLVYYK